MSKSITFVAKPEGTNLALSGEEKQLLKEWIAHQANYRPNCHIKLQLTPVKDPKRVKRSLPQNSHYWGVTIPILADGIEEATGEPCTPEDAHNIAKAKFLAEERYIPATGEILSFVGSTTELTPSEFADYEAKVIAWANAFFGLSIS